MKLHALFSASLACCLATILFQATAFAQDSENPFAPTRDESPFTPQEGSNPFAPSGAPVQDENPFANPPEQVDESPFAEPVDEEPFAEDDGGAMQDEPVQQQSPFGVPVEEEDPFNSTQPEADEPQDDLEDPFAQQPEANGEQESILDNGSGNLAGPADDQDPLDSTQEVRDGGQAKLPGDRPFEELFWEYLKSNAYENWAPVPGETDDFYAGKSPHGAFLKMYLNRTAAGNPDTLPVGSIIVKENYDIERSLKAITVMYRSRGFDPENSDWYWVKFNPDGTVATGPEEMGAQKLMGRVDGCIKCHSGAGGDDFAFFNDD